MNKPYLWLLLQCVVSKQSVYPVAQTTYVVGTKKEVCARTLIADNRLLLPHIWLQTLDCPRE